MGAGNFASIFALDSEGFSAVFFHVSTTAGFSGNVEVCVHYADADQDGLVDGTTVDERALALLHQTASSSTPTASSSGEGRPSWLSGLAAGTAGGSSSTFRVPVGS